MDDDFLREQRRAIERMNEMYRDRQIKTGGYKMPPAPPFVRVNGVGEVAEKEGAYKNKETAENKSEKVNKAKLDKNSNQTNSNMDNLYYYYTSTTNLNNNHLSKLEYYQ